MKNVIIVKTMPVFSVQTDRWLQWWYSMV